MLILIPLAIFPVMTNFVAICESKDPSKETRPKSSIQLPTKTTTTSIESSSTSPLTDVHTLSDTPHLVLREYNPKYLMFRRPHTLTKLAKSLALGFDPTFNVDYFQPFERRTRPVTLIGFRKNGILPRHSVQHTDNEPPEIAELQSPFNQLGTVWEEESGKP